MFIIICILGNNNLSVKPGQSLNLDWGYHSNAFYFVCTDIKSGAKPTHLPRQCTRVVESDPHDTTCGLSPHESAFPSAITHPHQPNNSISTVHCDSGSCKITASDSGGKNSVLNTLNTQHVGAQSGDTTHCTGSQTRVPNIHSLQTSMCDTIDGTADSRVDGALSEGGSMLGLPDYDRPMFRLDCQDIWHLNDIDSNSAFCKAIEHCISKQVDTSGGWSMLTITKGETHFCKLFKILFGYGILICKTKFTINSANLWMVTAHVLLSFLCLITKLHLVSYSKTHIIESVQNAS